MLFVRLMLFRVFFVVTKNMYQKIDTFDIGKYLYINTAPCCLYTRLSGLNLGCLKMFGVQKIYKKCHHLIAAKALDMFYGMLYNYGVRQVDYYEVTGNFRKHYGYFTIDGKS